MNCSTVRFVAIVLLSAVAWGAGPDRLPLPDKQSQALADASIRNLYKDEFAKHEATDRVALADKLIQVASESQSDAAGQFALLKEAQALATQAADAMTTLRAVEALTLAFDLDRLPTELAALQQVAPNAKTQQALRGLVDASLRLCDEAIDADQFDLAARSITIASTAAEKSRDKDFIARARHSSANLELDRQEHVKVEEAIKRLQTSPGDPESSTIVGRFLCLKRDDWEKGVPCLARASDSDLQSIGKHELAAHMTAEEMADLADEWWQWAGGSDHDKRGRVRAGYWYGRALPELIGLRKSLAEKRVEESSSIAIASERVVDLIPLIDLSQDIVAGGWEKKRSSLINTEPVRAARVRIRYQPPPEYDFRISFVRREGSEAVNQLLLAGEHRFNWTIAGLNNTLCGFELIAGKRVMDNPTTFHAESVLKNGTRYTSIVQVRRDSIAAWLNGKLIASYRTNFSDLDPEPGWDVGPDALGVGSWTNRTEFVTIELVEVTGHGRMSSATR